MNGSQDNKAPTPLEAEHAPSLPVMHAAFVLSGLGTMLLGPILPILAAQWHLNDSHSGLLVLSQFCGATIGGGTTTHKLRSGLLVGLISAVIGFFAFAFSPSLAFACPALVLGGFGVGRTVTAINILAGQRYAKNRGSALSWLNFSWSFGALLSPLGAAWLATRFHLSTLLTALSLLFLTVGILIAIQFRRTADTYIAQPQHDPTPPIRLPLFLYFVSLLFLYGGLETCLAAWLTTYALRYGQSSLVLSEYTMVLFLCGLTAGRALAARLLLRMPEARLQRISLLLAAAITLALASVHTAALIATFAVLLGITLAPIFPATFAIALSRKPRARQSGLILAASGLGAAALPSLLGVISTRSGSLQIALILPVAAAFLMFGLTLLPISNAPAQTGIPEPTSV